MFGIVLALLSAMSFGLSQILVRRNLEKSSAIYISITVTLIGNIILWPLALTYTDMSTLNPEGLLLFVFAGLLAPAIARLYYFKGMESVGISVNATIFSVYPLYTSIVAVLLLGEMLTAENWIGLACIIIGVIFVGKNIDNCNSNTKKALKSALIFSVLGSLALSFSQIVRKEGLNVYNQPLLGVAVSYTTTLIFYVLFLAFSKNYKTRAFSLNDIRMFWKPGIGIAIGWMLSFLALSQELVSIVVPVLQTELLFILLFTCVFLRKIEEISFKLAASALLIIVGVMLISIN